MNAQAVYQAAQARMEAGKQDEKDEMIVGLWDALGAMASKQQETQKALDLEKQGNAQSAQAITDMTMRLAGMNVRGSVAH
jgi:hypothetical protein